MKRKKYSSVDDNQMSLFSAVEVQKDDHVIIQEVMYKEWLSLPDIRLIREDDVMRHRVKAELHRGYCRLWRSANHVCSGIPEDKYIWLNCVEPAEYWVINTVGNPCGEHIEICPYCGADLKSGCGDVELVKADEGWWVINGLREKTPDSA